MSEFGDDMRAWRDHKRRNRDRVAELNTLDRIRGLYVGQLDSDERRIFEEAVRKGRAFRDYGGPSGFLGLAKVGIV